MKSKDYYGDINARTEDWATETSSSSPSPGLEFMIHSVKDLPVDGGRFLDIGCQAGHLVDAVNEYFDQSFGSDIADYGEYWKDIDGASFFVHDLDSSPLPFPDDYFDVVSCFMVLEHVFDVFGAVEEIARLTKPDKYVILEVPNSAYLRHILSLIRGRVPRTGSKRYPFEPSKGWDGQHLHYFTFSEVAWLCRQFDLDVVDHASRGRCPNLRKLCPSLFYASIALTLRKDV